MAIINDLLGQQPLTAAAQLIGSIGNAAGIQGDNPAGANALQRMAMTPEQQAALNKQAALSSYVQSPDFATQDVPTKQAKIASITGDPKDVEGAIASTALKGINLSSPTLIPDLLNSGNLLAIDALSKISPIITRQQQMQADQAAQKADDAEQGASAQAPNGATGTPLFPWQKQSSSPPASAVATVESANNPQAVSSKGAVGTMQTMPSTLANPGYGVTPAKDNSPEEQTRVGNDYYAAMQAKYPGKPNLALMAYNWGPQNVDDMLAGKKSIADMPMETLQYPQKVNAIANATPKPPPGYPPIPFRGSPPQATSQPNTISNTPQQSSAPPMTGVQQKQNNSSSIATVEPMKLSHVTQQALQDAHNASLIPGNQENARAAVMAAQSRPDYIQEKARVEAQTQAQARMQEEENKNNITYENAINERANNAIPTLRTLAKMQDYLKDMNPGKAAGVQVALAQYKIAADQAAGITPNPTEVKLAASTEGFDKLSFQLATQAIKSFSNKGTNLDLTSEIGSNPNKYMTPQGVKNVMDFMQKTISTDVQKQQDFAKWKQNNSHYPDFDTEWNQKQVDDIPNIIKPNQGAATPSQQNPKPTKQWARVGGKLVLQ